MGGLIPERERESSEARGTILLTQVSTGNTSRDKINVNNKHAGDGQDAPNTAVEWNLNFAYTNIITIASTLILVNGEENKKSPHC